MKELLTSILQKIPKGTIISLVILFAWAWSNQQIADNKKQTTAILDGQKELRSEIFANKQTIINGFNASIQRDNAILDSFSLVRGVQKIVVKSMKEGDRKRALDYQQMYREMHQDRIGYPSEEFNYIIPVSNNTLVAEDDPVNKLDIIISKLKTKNNASRTSSSKTR